VHRLILSGDGGVTVNEMICEHSDAPCDLLARDKAVGRLVEAARHAVATLKAIDGWLLLNATNGDGKLWDIYICLKEAVEPFREG
jgi:hypothetical protein